MKRKKIKNRKQRSKKRKKKINKKINKKFQRKSNKLYKMTSNLINQHRNRLIINKKLNKLLLMILCECFNNVPISSQNQK